jgi:hydrogenase-4 component E
MLLETLLVMVVLANLALLGSRRLGLFIRMVGVQGAVVSLAFWAQPHAGSEVRWAPLVLTVVGVVLKGFVFPHWLLRAVKEMGVRREVEPYVGYTASLFLGILAWGMSVWLGGRLPLPIEISHPGQDLLVPVGLFTIFVGLFLLMARRNAITQVLGYLVMENGIYLFGSVIEGAQPLVVELGILLDVFVAVFVMVITMFQINREIADIHLDTAALAHLKD